MIFYYCCLLKQQRYNFENEKTNAKRSNILTLMYLGLGKWEILYVKQDATLLQIHVLS